MVLIQELDSNGKPRKGVDPQKVTEEFWNKLKASKVGAKRYKIVQTKKEKSDERR